MSEATSSPPSPPLTVALASPLRMAVLRLARRLRAERADDSLSDGQFAVLAILSVHGPHALGALAERERVTAPSMNRTVNCLESAGYVRREADEDDARRVRILLTDAGIDLVAETVRRRDAWLDAVLDSLPEADREAVARAVPLLEVIAAR